MITLLASNNGIAHRDFFPLNLVPVIIVRKMKIISVLLLCEMLSNFHNGFAQ